MYTLLCGLHGTPLVSARKLEEKECSWKIQEFHWEPAMNSYNSIETAIAYFQLRNPSGLKRIQSLAPSIKKIDEEAEFELQRGPPQTGTLLDKTKADLESKLQKVKADHASEAKGA
jgi:hypothetical protein